MALLAIDLKTDFPRSALGPVEVQLTKRTAPGRMLGHFSEFLSLPSGDLVRGVRLVEINRLESGDDYNLVVRLLDPRGAPVALRRVIVTMSRNTIVTVVIPR